ncbi:MAG TPA: SPOR domain-containing protein [Caulobacterales bacterium]|nr:SPOR domain-containing protein [Caulobacterales bacterium]
MDLGAGERVYMPPMDEDPYRIRAGGVRSRRAMVVVIMGVVLVAFAAMAWNIYGRSGPAPVIVADGAFKTAAPAPASSADDTRDVYNMIEAAKGAAPPISVSTPVAPEAPAAITAPEAPEAPSAGQGGYLVQLGALRTPEAADAAWSQMNSSHPELLRGVKKDLQRADLGAQGIYYRLRAGFFGDRGQANTFCERVKGAGLACMVVVR